MHSKLPFVGVALLALGGCGHLRRPAGEPLATLTYEPAWFDKAWTVVVMSDGRITETVRGRIGPDSRAFPSLAPAQLAKVRESVRALAESHSPANLDSGIEDQATFSVSAASEVHRLYGPRLLACVPAAAPVLAVWNAVVQARAPRAGCAEVETCVVKCRGGSPNPSFKRTRQKRRAA